MWLRPMPQENINAVGSIIATAFLLYCMLGLVVLLVSTAIAPIFPHLFNVPPAFREATIIAVLLMGLSSRSRSR